MFGGPAFSEALLCRHLKDHYDLRLLSKKGKCDAAFVSQWDLPPVAEFTLADCVKAAFFRTGPLVDLFQTARALHINGHWQVMYWFLRIIAKREEVPYVLHPRGMLLLGHRKVALKKVFNWLIGNSIVRDAAKVIALSHFERTQFEPYHLSPSRVEVVPNSIEAPAKISRDLVKEDHFFLYFGRIEQRKNLPFLLDAYTEYRRMGGKSSLLLIGPVERGHDKELAERIHSLGLDAEAKILPPVFNEKKWAYLSKATAVIYPAKEEPFGRVPFEALAAGSAPLVPKQSGAAEYIEPFISLSTYDDTNILSLAERLAEVESTRSRMTKEIDEAREWLDHELNPTAIGERFVVIYQSL